MSLATAKNHIPFNPNRQTAYSFLASTSTHIFKQVLLGKQKELAHTRDSLFSQALVAQKESENVKKLQNALSKAMGYYTRVEAWQEKESRALQEGIKVMKEEIGSMMAWIIKTDRERQQVTFDRSGSPVTH